MDPSYITSLDFDWSKPELSLKGEPKGLMITDCKSLYDLITKNAVPNSPECRTTIEIVLLKKQSRDHTACRWVSIAIMIADCLTKPVDSRFMWAILQFGNFRIYDASLSPKQNANRKFGVTWVHNRIIKRGQWSEAAIWLLSSCYQIWLKANRKWLQGKSAAMGCGRIRPWGKVISGGYQLAVPSRAVTES